MLDERQALLVEDLERRERPGQERHPLDVRRRARSGLAAGPAAGSTPVARRPSAVLRAAGRDRRVAGVVVPASAHRRRRPPAPSRAPAARRPRARCGIGAVLWGKAMASTKCSWKRGSTAVSIFSTRRTTVSISRRAAPESRAMSAPVPGRVAGRPDVGEVAVGDQPEDHRVEQVDLAAERPGEPDLVDLVDAQVVHQQPDARVQRRLRQLDRPDVVLGDDDPRRARARRPRGGRTRTSGRRARCGASVPPATRRRSRRS